MRLTKIDGISDTKEAKLKKYGYQQLEDVAFANPVHFSQIPNVSTDRIQEAIRTLQEFPACGFRFDDPTHDPDAMRYYWCGECGQTFREGWILANDDGKPPGEKKYHNCDPNARMGATLRGNQ